MYQREAREGEKQMKRHNETERKEKREGDKK